MPLQDASYAIAYIVFLFGAAGTMRSSKARTPLWVMCCGITIDFFATVVPWSGTKSLAINVGANPQIVAAIVLGFVPWAGFLLALVARLMGKTPLFHGLLVLIEATWFVDLVLFVIGVYQ